MNISDLLAATGTVKADITLTNGQQITRWYDDYYELGGWMERHHDHILEIAAKMIQPNMMGLCGGNTL